jgi:hypothetical protein
MEDAVNTRGKRITKEAQRKKGAHKFFFFGGGGAEYSEQYKVTGHSEIKIPSWKQGQVKRSLFKTATKCSSLAVFLCVKQMRYLT